jgi:hypothetical protein
VRDSQEGLVGILWLFHNAAPLGLIALLIVCALMALYCGIRAYRAGR